MSLTITTSAVKEGARIRADISIQIGAWDPYTFVGYGGGDGVERASEALRNYPSATPEGVTDEEALDQAYERAVEAALGFSSRVLQLNAILQGGPEPSHSSALRDLLDASKSQLEELPEGHGKCSVCGDVFRLHHIAGANDLCMRHINPGFL